MSPMRAVLCVALLAATAVCAAQPLPGGTDECLARIEAQREAPSEQRAAAPLVLGDACPELAEDLQATRWSEALTNGSPLRELDAAAFVDLVALVERYREPQRPQPLSLTALDAALAELEDATPPAELSWWERGLEWLQEHLGRGRTDGDTRLGEWLAGISVSERLVRWLVLAAGLTLVGVTLVIVGNELRAAGVFGARRSARRMAVAGGDDGVQTAVRARTFADVRAAPIFERPVVLLGLVLEQWRRHGGGVIRPSLTHRELARETAQLDAAKRESLRAVLDAAERVTFGAWRPAESEVDEIMTHGEALLASWAADEAGRR